MRCANWRLYIIFASATIDGFTNCMRTISSKVVPDNLKACPRFVRRDVATTISRKLRYVFFLRDGFTWICNRGIMLCLCPTLALDLYPRPILSCRRYSPRINCRSIPVLIAQQNNIKPTHPLTWTWAHWMGRVEGSFLWGPGWREIG